MLVLTRKLEETIKIGSDIVVKVIRLERGIVKLGIEAPAHVRILRGELIETPVAPATRTSSTMTTVSDSHSMPQVALTQAKPELVVSPAVSHKFLMDFESGYVADLEDQRLVSAAS